MYEDKLDSIILITLNNLIEHSNSRNESQYIIGLKIMKHETASIICHLLFL